MPVFDFYTKGSFSNSKSDFFFNSPEYIGLLDPGSSINFRLLDEDSQLVAVMNFQRRGDEAVSLIQAPFGFLETSIEDETVLVKFLTEVENSLKDLKISAILLKSWPVCYHPTQSRFLSNLLQENSFELQFEDYNFFAEVTANALNQRFHKQEKKRLRKCIRQGLKVNILTDADTLEFYNYLSRFRKEKNIPLNISSEDFCNSVSRFPDRYVLFTIQDQGKVIGVSVCVVVNKDILYHFALATSLEFNNLSPAVMLYERIYSYCQEKGYRIFDFGTASIKGEKQQGLFQFKENLGGSVCMKPVFRKLLQ